jgi:hypothetical protein
MPNIFRKPIEEIELLTAQEAAERFIAADKSFIIEETLKYYNTGYYKKNPNRWSGTEGFAKNDEHLIFSLFNQTKKGVLCKRGFHDEFKILKTDESKYVYLKHSKYEDAEFTLILKHIKDIKRNYDLKQKEIQNANSNIIFTFFKK